MKRNCFIRVSRFYVKSPGRMRLNFRAQPQRTASYIKAVFNPFSSQSDLCEHVCSCSPNRKLAPEFLRVVGEVPPILDPHLQEAAPHPLRRVQPHPLGRVPGAGLGGKDRMWVDGWAAGWLCS